MGNSVSEYDFELCVDPYDANNAAIRDRTGVVIAVVNRLAAEHGDGLDVARLLRAAPAMLRALEVALEAYSPISHLLGVECNAHQKYAALKMREAIGLALYGPTAQSSPVGDYKPFGFPETREEVAVTTPESPFTVRQLATG